MALVNRDKDTSEKKLVMNFQYNALIGTGATVMVALVPCPATLKKVQVAAVGGLSGAPVYNVNIHRFVSGAGVTVFDPVGAAVTLAGAFGLSQASYTFNVTTGSTLISLQKDDMIVLKSSGANTALLGLVASIVLQKTEDILSLWGSQT